MQTTKLEGQEEQDHGHQRNGTATAKGLVSYAAYDIAYDVLKLILKNDKITYKT